MNINNYRNLHYMLLNKAKVVFTELLEAKVSELPIFKRIKIRYTLFTATKRKCDVANVCSIVDKFFCDVLTKTGRIKDDNYDYLPEVIYKFGGVDSDNPRVLAEIKEIPNEQ